MNMSVRDAYKLIDEMALGQQQWSPMIGPIRGAPGVIETFNKIGSTNIGDAKEHRPLNQPKCFSGISITYLCYLWWRRPLGHKLQLGWIC
jgi:hypothetical protein